jgi:hypothetical protein
MAFGSHLERCVGSSASAFAQSESTPMLTGVDVWTRLFRTLPHDATVLTGDEVCLVREHVSKDVFNAVVIVFGGPCQALAFGIVRQLWPWRGLIRPEMCCTSDAADGSETDAQAQRPHFCLSFAQCSVQF